MDAVDVRILRRLGILPFVHGPRGPEALRPSRIAEGLGVSAKTVRRHLRRLEEEEGVIGGYQVYPNFRHLGVTWGSYFFRVPAEEKEGLPSLEAVEGLVGILDFFGPDLCVDLCFRDGPELRRRLRVVSELLGGSQAADWYLNRMPPADGPLSNLDWRIVRGLRNRARTPLSEVSGEVGVTTRTVRRRLRRMVAEGGIDVVPLVNPARMRDALPAAFLYRLDPDRAQAVRPTILDAFASSYLAAWVPPSPQAGHFITLMIARRMADLDEMRHRAAGLPGVQAVEAFIPSDMWHHEDWIDEAIQRKVEETGPAR